MNSTLKNPFFSVFQDHYVDQLHVQPGPKSTDLYYQLVIRPTEASIAVSIGPKMQSYQVRFDQNNEKYDVEQLQFLQNVLERAYEDVQKNRVMCLEMEKVG